MIDLGSDSRMVKGTTTCVANFFHPSEAALVIKLLVEDDIIGILLWQQLFESLLVLETLGH